MASRQALKVPRYVLLFFPVQEVTGIYSINVVTWVKGNTIASVLEKGVTCTGEVIAQNGKCL